MLDKETAKPIWHLNSSLVKFFETFKPNGHCFDLHKPVVQYDQMDRLFFPLFGHLQQLKFALNIKNCARGGSKP